MRIAKTTDTGSVGDVYLLSEEFMLAAGAFERDTADVRGELFIAFRSLPREYGRRSTVRYSSAEDVLFLDLAVVEENIAALTVDEQRNLLRAELTDLIRRGVRSRTATWSTAQRRQLRDAFDAMLGDSTGSPSSAGRDTCDASGP